MRILFTANPLVGHVFPMLPLMHAAREAGHEVVMATGAEMIPDLHRRGFTAWTVGPSFGQAVAELERASVESAATHEDQLVRDAIFLFGRPSVLRAFDLVPRAAAWRPEVVVSEITEFAGREAAYASGALPVTHGFGTHVPGTRALAGLIFDHLSKGLGLPNRQGDFETGIYLDPCPPGLQSDELSALNIWPVRPIVGQVTVDEHLPVPLPTKAERPIVYLTLGTVVNDPELARSVLDAVQDLPISLVVTTGPDVDPSVLGERPANVLAASFIPQALLMPHVSAVVSHTGSGTMLGALASGLPQVCLPRGADQFANADRVRSIGAGVRLLPEEVTDHSLRSALTTVLDDPAYTRAAQRIQAEIEAMPSADEVLDDLVAETSPQTRTA